MTRGFFVPHSSYFFSSLLLLLLLLFLHLLSTAAREWHIANLYLSLEKPKRLPLVIYPKFNQCTNEDDLRMQLDWTSEEGNWSSSLNQYLFYMANIPDSHGEELMVDVFATFRYVVLIGPIFFFLCYFLFTTLALLLTIPFGAILFFIFGPIFFLVGKITYYIGRHLLICFESCSRRKERMVMPKSMRKLKTSYRPRNFRLPYFFRKSSDEQFHKAGWASSENEQDNDNNSDSSDEEEKQLVEELERKVRLRAFSTSLTLFRKNVEAEVISKSKLKSNQVHPEQEPAPEFHVLFDESNKDKDKKNQKSKYNSNEIIFDTLENENGTDDEVRMKIKEKSLSILLAPQPGKRVTSFTESKESQKSIHSQSKNQDVQSKSRSKGRSKSKRSSKKKHHVVGTQTTMESQFHHEDTFVHLPQITASTTGGFKNLNHSIHHHGHGHRVKGRPQAGALGRTKRRRSHGLDPDVRETKADLNHHHHSTKGNLQLQRNRSQDRGGTSAVRTTTSILSQVSRTSVGTGQRKSQSHSQSHIPQIRIYSAGNTLAVPSRTTSDNTSPSHTYEIGEKKKKKKKHRKKSAKKKMMRTPSNLSQTASNVISNRNAHVKPHKKRKKRKRPG